MGRAVLSLMLTLVGGALLVSQVEKALVGLGAGRGLVVRVYSERQRP